MIFILGITYVSIFVFYSKNIICKVLSIPTNRYIQSWVNIQFLDIHFFFHFISNTGVVILYK